MSLRSRLRDFSQGDGLWLFWKLFWLRGRVRSRWTGSALTFLLSRMAHRHGGYIGRDAVIEGIPSLPHGLHGVYISRYARLGADCRIYQNVTIGEVSGRAPQIGRGCLIGANACVIGGVTVGDGARIGAGAVVACDVPAGGTVVAQPPRVFLPSEDAAGSCL